ncbi:MAG: hypothetical protein A2061_11105 [Gallionellales bacterium GWA2_59_43]|nr:MAG: hypothetical protein A2061_11105 [Gallionellales bacterium GWA2_59_43]
MVTGLIDDVADIGPRWKFVGQMLAAGTFVGLGGGSLVNLGSFLGGGEMMLGAFAVPFTIFCMVGGMNAFNLSDGLDGLAGGFAAIVAAVFAFFSWKIGAPDLLLVCVALLGAVIGFLRYNSYPAKLFMGDCGSLTLGYVLTALLVSGSQRDAGSVPLVAWAMVMALPLLDTLLVMARRIRHGNSPFVPDRTHLHHRLMVLGLAHPGVVAVMYAVMAFFGMLALVMQGLPDWQLFAALGLSGAVMFGGVSALQHGGVSFEPGGRKHSYNTLRQWPQFRHVIRLVMASAIPVSVFLLSLLCVPALFFSLPELNRNEALALILLGGVVVFYSLLSGQAYKGMLHGSVYASIFTLFFLYNIPLDDNLTLARIYLTSISVLAAVWVLIKIVFRQNALVLKTSSFELLMVFLSWFMPFVLFEELRLPEPIVEAGRLACLQVLPFMLTAKIYFNLQPQGNKWVVGGLAGAIAVIALRGVV